jgi:hypothetical protein
MAPTRAQQQRPESSSTCESAERECRQIAPLNGLKRGSIWQTLADAEPSGPNVAGIAVDVGRRCLQQTLKGREICCGLSCAPTFSLL